MTVSAADEIVYFTEDNSAEVVLARNAEPENARLAEVMRSVLTHLHADFVAGLTGKHEREMLNPPLGLLS